MRLGNHPSHTVCAGLILWSGLVVAHAQAPPSALPDIDPLPTRERPRDLADEPENPAPALRRPDRREGPTARPIRLADALAMSLRNVETVQANLEVRTATVARFEALKAFVPLMNLPQLAVGFNRLTGAATTGQNIIFPDVTDGVPLVGRPGLDYAQLSRFNIFLPLDPSGHITALPIAEEGIRAKVMMEQLVRRYQAVLAAQRYFDAKQIQYGLRVSSSGINLAAENLGFFERKLREQQAHDVEISQAKVSLGKSKVFMANLEKDSRISERRLGVVLHQCRLLVPQELGPVPIEPECTFAFDLLDPDLVDPLIVPDFPQTREQAVERAKRQRLEVRLMVVGLRIARLKQTRDKTRLFGLGQLPLGMSFKNTSPGNGGIAFGMIFGTLYDLPLVDIGLWAGLRQAKLDVIRSQLDLEKSLLDVAEDAGSSWDRWQQSIREWEQREAEYRLSIEYRDRLVRLYNEKQVIRLDVMGADLNLLQADANRWTAWYNLQLARLDILRATELLLDFIEKAGITDFPKVPDEPAESSPRHRYFGWMARAGRAELPDQTGE
jgi:outer membrane protein TolC